MKFARRQRIVEAEVYQVGLEDGFSCIPLVSMCRWKNKDGCYKDCGSCSLDIEKKPFIQCLFHKEYINEGNYIVTDEVGDKIVMSVEDFEAAYVQVEENSDCDN